MDLQIALFLIQDGVVNGAIYALLGMALVLAFTVTRVIFIPQGEFVAWGALSLAALQAGKLPGTVWLLAIGGCAVMLVELWTAWRGRDWSGIARAAGWNLVYPALMFAAVHFIDFEQMPMAVQVLAALLIVVPMGPMVWRLAFQPVAESSVLVLLIVSVAVHVAMVGLGLLFFGAEGSRTPPFTEGGLELGGIPVPAQTLWVVGCSIALILALTVVFGRTLYGKALRATAVNRVGARLMGIPTSLAGRLSFTLCALIGAFSGILIAPLTTIYYDTGFLIGLKGFVAAIIAGLASYPLAAAGAVLVGLLEAFSSFAASAYKEVIVFTLIIPVLIWRSLSSRHVEEE
ncbi:High-affinity branched-chain amino acid transport system permease protein LivH [Pigmentiphaga humi]|uniref:High-affinity branched-chain amino acid transport system permease protein LivH n=1 Tax=Pigmentiphaga humi TaxID=2478468 RepID=A0A3P4B8V4_9BURK|nr:branched-chain amino acid ABC transporter permease [Pigmentiphaga humi]VCU71946.1 High-affinity branched-chain amino acid transport system permease protein LivH [Pigmentiphaga humi]